MIKENKYYINEKSPYIIYVNKIIKKYQNSIYLHVDLIRSDGIIERGNMVEIGDNYINDWKEIDKEKI